MKVLYFGSPQEQGELVFKMYVSKFFIRSYNV